MDQSKTYPLSSPNLVNEATKSSRPGGSSSSGVDMLWLRSHDQYRVSRGPEELVIWFVPETNEIWHTQARTGAAVRAASFGAMTESLRETRLARPFGLTMKV